MLRLSVPARIKLTKLLLIIIVWLFIGWVMSLYDHFAFQSEYIKSLGEVYSFNRNLLLNMGGALMGALMGGTFLIFYVNEKFREKSYGFTILAVAVSFIIIIAIITLVLGVFVAIQQTGKSLFHPDTVAEYKKFITDPLHIKNIIWWAPVVALTQFVLQVNDKFGQGVLWNFLKGKYHSPKEEMRIFMFVDLQSSTTIAEKLGIEKYHYLLKDFFADVTNAILYNKGQIYQYVGDEIVISWKLDEGIASNHCLHCFFDMRRAIQKKKDKYENHYGLVPEFKAGMHYGKVLAGEIGIIKRDITYSGDVLNTASRIQSKCNEYGAKFLSSDELLELMPYQQEFTKQVLGNIELKGKEQKISLSSLQLAGE